jgi:hypothetical protein
MNFKFFYHLNSHKIFFYLFLGTFACQIFFWKETEKTRASFELIPQVPNKYALSIFSLGDNEFLFRVLATRLQNSGDVFAGFAALKNYDYTRIYDWMKMLDGLNDKSVMVPSLASYIYSQTQNKDDNYLIVKYLDEHAAIDLDNNWWWLMQAVFIAKKDLQDMNLAIELADKLAKNEAKNAPSWTRFMNAVLREKTGDNCAIFRVVENLVQDLNRKDGTKLSAGELDLQRHFIKSHLDKLKEEKFDPKKCHYKKS